MAPLKLQVVGLDSSSFSLRVDSGWTGQQLLQPASGRWHVLPGAASVGLAALAGETRSGSGAVQLPGIQIEDDGKSERGLGTRRC